MLTIIETDPLPTQIRRLLSAGWTEGPPADLPEDALDADEAAAAEMPCENCDATGGRYRAAHRLVPMPTYRAWSVCHACNHPTEL